MRKTKPHPLYTLVLLALLGFYFYTTQKPEQEQEQATAEKIEQVTIVSQNQTSIGNGNSRNPKISKPRNSTPITEQDNQLNLEPVIETKLTKAKYEVCARYFYAKNFLSSPYVSRYKTDIQKQYFKRASQNCEELNTKHPEYQFEFTRQDIKERSKIKGISRFGKLLEFNKTPYTVDDTLFVYEIVGREFPELINSSSIYKVWQYQIDTVNPNLQDILSTTNINYVSKIIRHSQNYLACELGVNCGYDSSIMYKYCKSEVNFCVNDFQTLYNSRFSYAVQNDILLALPYIKSLYQVD